MFNPTRKRKSSGRSGGARRSGRRNPSGNSFRRRSARHFSMKRRNPSRLREVARSAMPSNLTQWGELGVGAVAGALGSGWLTNFAASWGVSGFVSYLIQGAISIFGGGAIAKYANKYVGVGFAAGGLGAVIVRAIQENTASHPVAIAQAAAANGSQAAVVPALPPGQDSTTLMGLGTYVPFNFNYPSTNQWVGGKGSGLAPGPAAGAPVPPGLPAPSMGSVAVGRDNRW